MRTISGVLTAVLAVGLSACAQPKEDPKVAQMQQELEAVKKQLADAQQGQAATAQGQAAATNQALDAAKPAQETAAPATQNAAAAQKTATTAVSQTEQAARDRQATEKALADQANEQKAAAARQAAENERLRKELDEMKPREFTLPSGTVIPVRTTSALSTAKVKDGSVFDAVLEKDIVVDGTTLAKAGALVTCVVVSSDAGGRVKGRANLTVAARTVHAVNGNSFAVKTDSYSTEAESTKKKDAVRTGIATGAGAIIGGIAGGGSGAAIGAGAGAAAGVGTAMATRGAAAVIPTETLMEFTLSAPAKVILRK